METIVLPNKNCRFHLAIRIIAAILIVSFLAYDISWANPDALQVQLKTPKDDFRLTFEAKYLAERARDIAEFIESHPHNTLSDIASWEKATDRIFDSTYFTVLRTLTGPEEIRIAVFMPGDSGRDNAIILRYSHKESDAVPAGLVTAAYFGFDKELKNIRRQVFLTADFHKKLISNIKELPAPPEAKINTRDHSPSQDPGYLRKTLEHLKNFSIFVWGYLKPFIFKSEAIERFAEIHRLRNIALKYLEAGDDKSSRHEFRKWIFTNWLVVRQVLSGNTYSAPLYLEIHTTNQCNSKCRWCDHRSQSAGHDRLSRETLLALIDNLHDEGLSPSIRFSGFKGEPLINPATLEAIERAVSYGIRVGMNTNGILLNERASKILLNADFVNISLDATSPETNAILRGEPDGFWERKIENIRKFAEMKKLYGSKVKINVSVILQPETYRQIPELARFLKSIGIDDFVVKVAHFDDAGKLSPEELAEAYEIMHRASHDLSDHRFHFYLMQDIDEASEKMGGVYRRPDAKRCYAAIFATAISPSAIAWPCCHGEYGTFGAVGKVSEEEGSFGRMWRGRQRQELLYKGKPEACKYCAPKDSNVNAVFESLESGYNLDLGFLSFVKASLDNDGKVARSYGIDREITGLINPYFFGMPLRILRFLGIYNTRDIIHSLSAQARSAGYVRPQVLRQAVHQPVGNVDIYYNKGVDHEIKGRPVDLPRPVGIIDAVDTYGLAALYIIPRIYIRRALAFLRHDLHDGCPLCEAHPAQASFRWNSRWSIRIAPFPHTDADHCSLVFNLHSTQDLDLRDIADLARYAYDTPGARVGFNSVGAGDRIGHKSAQDFGSPQPIEQYQERLESRQEDIEIAELADNIQTLKLKSPDVDTLAALVSEAVSKMKELHLAYNLYIYRDGDIINAYVIPRAKESSSVFGQRHGVAEMCRNLVLTKPEGFAKVDLSKVSLKDAKKAIADAYAEIGISTDSAEASAIRNAVISKARQVIGARHKRSISFSTMLDTQYFKPQYAAGLLLCAIFLPGCAGGGTISLMPAVIVGALAGMAAGLGVYLFRLHKAKNAVNIDAKGAKKRAKLEAEARKRIEKTRREFLKISAAGTFVGVLGGYFASYLSRRPGGETLSKDWTAEGLRNAIISKIEALDDFSAEIQNIVIPDSMHLTREDIAQGVRNFKDIVKSARVKFYDENDYTVNFSINLTKDVPEIGIRKGFIDIILGGDGDRTLFHESIHCVPFLLKKTRSLPALTDGISRFITEGPGGLNISPSALRDKEFQRLASEIVRIRWREELWSYYLEYAAMDYRAKKNGMSVEEYLRKIARDLSVRANDGRHPGTIEEERFRKFMEREAADVEREAKWAAYYRGGEISRELKLGILRANIIATASSDSMDQFIKFFIHALASSTFDKDFSFKKYNNGSEDYKKRFDDWMIANILESPDGDVGNITENVLPGAVITFAMAGTKAKSARKQAEAAAEERKRSETTRRQFLKLAAGGTVIGSLVGYYIVSRPSKKEPITPETNLATSSPSDDARTKLIEVLKRSNYFKAEIEGMTLPEEFRISREDMTEAIRRFSDFLNICKIEFIDSTPKPGTYMMPMLSILDTPEEKKLTIDINAYKDILNGNHLLIFHEAIHLNPVHKGDEARKMELRRMIEASSVISRSNGRKTISFPRKDVRVLGLYRELLRVTWQNEIEAHYIEMAANAYRAQSAGKSLEDYFKGLAAGRPSQKFILETSLDFARAFTPGAVSPKFQDLVFSGLFSSTAIGHERDILLILAQEEFDPLFDFNKTAGSSAGAVDYRRRFYEWARNSILKKNNASGLPGSSLSGQGIISTGVAASAAGLSKIAVRPFMSAQEGERVIEVHDSAGGLIKTYINAIPPDEFTRLDGVFVRLRLYKNGELRVGRKATWLRLVDYPERLADAEVQEGFISSVRVYKEDPTEGFAMEKRVFSQLVERTIGEDGSKRDRIVHSWGGSLKPETLAPFVKDHPRLVLKNYQLGPDGGVRFGGGPDLATFVNYKNRFIEADMEDGFIVKVRICKEDPAEGFEPGESVFSQLVTRGEDGKDHIVFTWVDKIRESKVNELIAKHHRLTAKNRRIGLTGVAQIGGRGKIYLKGYPERLIEADIEEGINGEAFITRVRVYKEDHKETDDPKEGVEKEIVLQQLVTRARDEQGVERDTIVHTWVEKLTEKELSGFMAKYPALVLKNHRLGGGGSLSFGDNSSMAVFSSYPNRLVEIDVLRGAGGKGFATKVRIYGEDHKEDDDPGEGIKKEAVFQQLVVRNTAPSGEMSDEIVHTWYFSCYEATLTGLMKKYPRLILKRSRLDERGALSFGNHNPWVVFSSYPNRVVEAEIERGASGEGFMTRMRIYGETHAEDADPAEGIEREEVFSQFAVRNADERGVLHDEIICSWYGQLYEDTFKDLLKRYPRFVLKNFRLDGHGTMAFGGKRSWASFTMYPGRLVEADVERGNGGKGFVTRARIYNETHKETDDPKDDIETEEVFSQLAVRARDDTGAVSDSIVHTWYGILFEDDLDSMIKRHPSLVLKNRRLDTWGCIDFANRGFQLMAYPGRLVELCLERGIDDRVFVTSARVYDEGHTVEDDPESDIEEERAFPRFVVDRKLNGGRHEEVIVASWSRQLAEAEFNELIQKYPSLILKNQMLDKYGKLSLGGKLGRLRFSRYPYSEVEVVFEQGKIALVYLVWEDKGLKVKSRVGTGYGKLRRALFAREIDFKEWLASSLAAEGLDRYWSGVSANTLVSLCLDSLDTLVEYGLITPRMKDGMAELDRTKIDIPALAGRLKEAFTRYSGLGFDRHAVERIAGQHLMPPRFIEYLWRRYSLARSTPIITRAASMSNPEAFIRSRREFLERRGGLDAKHYLRLYDPSRVKLLDSVARGHILEELKDYSTMLGKLAKIGEEPMAYHKVEVVPEGYLLSFNEAPNDLRKGELLYMSDMPVALRVLEYRKGVRKLLVSDEGGSREALPAKGVLTRDILDVTYSMQKDVVDRIIKNLEGSGLKTTGFAVIDKLLKLSRDNAATSMVGWKKVRYFDKKIERRLKTDEEKKASGESVYGEVWAGDQSHEAAVQLGLNGSSIEIVHGPAGTGKTTVIAELIRQHVKAGRRVLVVSHMNRAVDGALRAVMDEMPALRIGNDEAQVMAHGTYKAWIHNQTAIQEFERKGGKTRGFVFAATDIGIAADRATRQYLKQKDFDVVIMDESSHETLVGSFVPLQYLKDAGKFIIVGDTKQLKPFRSQEHVRRMLQEGVREDRIDGLFHSILSSVEGEGIADEVLLSTNWRSHPLLAGLVSKVFYGGAIQSRGWEDITPETMRLHAVDIGSDERQYFEEGVGDSYQNHRSATEVMRLLDYYIRKKHISPDKITVITPYVAQKELLTNLVKSLYLSPSRPHISTIDGYMGDENDVIIIDFVRSNRNNDIGFIRSIEKLCVAYSRARKNLAVVWDSRTFAGELKGRYPEDIREADAEAREVLRATEDYYIRETWQYYPDDLPPVGREAFIRALGSKVTGSMLHKLKGTANPAAPEPRTGGNSRVKSISRKSGFGLVELWVIISGIGSLFGTVGYWAIINGYLPAAIFITALTVSSLAALWLVYIVKNAKFYQSLANSHPTMFSKADRLRSSKHIILDLDGVILDTIKINRENAAYMYWKITRGIPDSSDRSPDAAELEEGADFYNTVILGNATKDKIPDMIALARKKGVPESALKSVDDYDREYRRRRDARINEILSSDPESLLKPGAREFIEAKHRAGARLYIASAAPNTRMKILDALGLTGLFTEIKIVQAGGGKSSLEVKMDAIGDIINGSGAQPEEFVFVDDAPSSVSKARGKMGDGLIICGMPATVADSLKMGGQVDFIVSGLSKLLDLPPLYLKENGLGLFEMYFNSGRGHMSFMSDGTRLIGEDGPTFTEEEQVMIAKVVMTVGIRDIQSRTGVQLEDLLVKIDAWRPEDAVANLSEAEAVAAELSSRVGYKIKFGNKLSGIEFVLSKEAMAGLPAVQGYNWEDSVKRGLQEQVSDFVNRDFHITIGPEYCSVNLYDKKTTVEKMFAGIKPGVVLGLGDSSVDISFLSLKPKGLDYRPHYLGRSEDIDPSSGISTYGGGHTNAYLAYDILKEAVERHERGEETLSAIIADVDNTLTLIDTPLEPRMADLLAKAMSLGVSVHLITGGIPKYGHYIERIINPLENAFIFMSSAGSNSPDASQDVTGPATTEGIRMRLDDAVVNLTAETGWGADDVIDHVILVSDNTGTFTRATYIPIEGDMLHAIRGFMFSEGNMLVVNTGDSHVDAMISQESLLAGLKASGIADRYHLIANAGKVMVDYNADGSVASEEIAESWPVPTRIRYARAILDAFFARLAVEAEGPAGVFRSVLEGVAPEDIRSAYKDAIERFDAIAADGRWGMDTSGQPERKFIFKLLTGELSTRLADPYIFDAGTDLCLEMQDVNMRFNEIVNGQKDVIRFNRSVESEIRQALSAEAGIYISYGKTFMDIGKSTKAMAVQRKLEKILETIPSNKKVLIIHQGDGRNDIPTFKLDYSRHQNVRALNFYLNHAEDDALELPGATYITEGELLEGGLSVTRWAGAIRGRRLGDVPNLPVKKWKAAVDQSDFDRPYTRSEPEIPSYQNIDDIPIREIAYGDDASRAIPFLFDPADPIEDIMPVVKEQLVMRNWWLQPYWIEKGLPKEHVSISIDGHTVNVYNWNNEPLSESHIAQMTDVLKTFFVIAGGKALRDCLYILIDDRQVINQKSGEEMNGYGIVHDGALTLYPRALRPIEFRIKGVSNLTGTLIHELSHRLDEVYIEDAGRMEILINIWAQRFGWQYLDKPRQLPGGFQSLYDVSDRGTCVTDYATYDPGEDICESMVAAIMNPGELARVSSGKLQLLRDALLGNAVDHVVLAGIGTNIIRREGNDVLMPRFEGEAIFKRTGKIAIRRVEDRRDGSTITRSDAGFGMIEAWMLVSGLMLGYLLHPAFGFGFAILACCTASADNGIIPGPGPANIPDTGVAPTTVDDEDSVDLSSTASDDEIVNAAMRLADYIHDGGYEAILTSGKSDEVAVRLVVAALGKLYPGDALPEIIRMDTKIDNLIYKSDPIALANMDRDSVMARLGETFTRSELDALLGLAGKRVVFIDDRSQWGIKPARTKELFRGKLHFTNFDYAVIAAARDIPIRQPGGEEYFAGTRDETAVAYMSEVSYRMGSARAHPEAPGLYQRIDAILFRWVKKIETYDEEKIAVKVVDDDPFLPERSVSTTGDERHSYTEVSASDEDDSTDEMKSFLYIMHQILQKELGAWPYVDEPRKILIAEELFNSEDVEISLRAVLNKAHIEILPAKDIRAIATRDDPNNSKHNLACILGRDQFESLWNGSHLAADKAMLIVLDDDFKNGRYLFLEAAIGFAYAVMSGDERRIHGYAGILFKETDVDNVIADEILNALRIPDSIGLTKVHLRFKTVPFNLEKLRDYKLIMEEYLRYA